MHVSSTPFAPRANRGAPLAPCHVVARLSARKHRPQHRVAHVAVHLAVGPHQPAGLERVVLLAAPVRGAPVLRQHLLAVKLVLQGWRSGGRGQGALPCIQGSLKG
eukprot:361917-Chlamydomonas_euryale.AAC.17